MFYIKPDERQILNKCFGELHQIVGTMLHLFGHIVKPGLLYDSDYEIYIKQQQSVKKGYFNLFNAISDLPCEKLHISFF